MIGIGLFNGVFHAPQTVVRMAGRFGVMTIVVRFGWTWIRMEFWLGDKGSEQLLSTQLLWYSICTFG